jgi:hypothetical protein
LIGSLLFAAAIPGLVGLGRLRWEAKNASLRETLQSGRATDPSAGYSSQKLLTLPGPVQRYFRSVLPSGQALIRGARVEQAGSFDLSGANEPRWVDFRAEQWVITGHPGYRRDGRLVAVGRSGFVWDARMRLAPGLSVFVRDAYVDGEGSLTASLLGLWTVAEQAGGPEMAQGELLRYLAEAAWYPTALLPSRDLRWDAIDEGRSRVTLVDGDVEASLEFRFDAEGHIASVYTDRRYRDVDGRFEITPWQGHFRDYQAVDGIWVPFEAEVEWILPEGPRPYWRARIEEIEFDLDR